MKKTALFLLIACCFCLAGCSKDAEINAFIAEFDSTTTEIVQKIDANPSAAGVDEAQKAFDAKKASLKAKWDGIKDAVGFQVSADVKKKLEDTVTKNMSALTQVSTKHMMKLAMDKEASSKFQALLKEYQGVFTPPSGSK
jgi:predicted  nucleic acid-binding Zn-ribbon protein